jgi:hypothetical protein
VNKLKLLYLVIIGAGSAKAAWIELPIKPPTDLAIIMHGTYYLETQSIERQGGYGKGTWMLTLDTPQALRAYKQDRRVYRSQIVEGEFNCQTR